MKIGFDGKRMFHNTTGLGNYSRDLLKNLAYFYPKNEYYLYNPKYRKVHFIELSEQMKEILPESKFWKKFSSIWRQKPIVKQIIKDQITLYHGLSGELPIGLSKTTIKSIVTIHDLIFVRYPKLYSFFDRKIYFKKFQYATKNADKIVAISNQTKQDIINFLKIDASKIEVIYQGCHAVFKQKQTLEFQNNVLKKYNLPSKFILNVGTIEKRKNVLTVIKAIKNIDVFLVVVGKKTTYFREINKYIKENKLQQKVYFLEGLSLAELAVLYQTSSMFVYPSIFEGFGIPIIEALYSKTPVITTIGGCFSEAGGEHSIYINPLNTKELTTQIKFLLNHPKKREIIIKKGYEFVQKFNDKNISKSYMDLYKSIIYN